jgi:hypothetical protein
VSPDIEGDHITAAVWRGRLHLFWVTFMPKSQPHAAPRTDSDVVAQLTFGALMQKVNAAAPPQQVQVQLHWSEYVQGTCSDRVSTDMNRYQPITVDDGFDPRLDVYIHVSKEVDAEGNEGAVRIHLDFQGYDAFYAFRVTSKNAVPDFVAEDGSATPPMPYTAPGIDATLHTGSGALRASFETRIAADGGGTTDTEAILQAVNNYALLACANPVAPPFLDPGEPRYQEAGSLVSPFFYKDTGAAATTNELTFFVQPSLTETTIAAWEGWAIGPAMPDPQVIDPDWVNHVTVVAQVHVAHAGLVASADPAYSLSLYPSG